jgi:hypothetical protein
MITQADMVIHMGDHAYNEGDNDERRADGYMSAWQPALANGMWMPIVGNHERVHHFKGQPSPCATHLAS